MDDDKFPRLLADHWFVSKKTKLEDFDTDVMDDFRDLIMENPTLLDYSKMTGAPRDDGKKLFNAAELSNLERATQNWNYGPDSLTGYNPNAHKTYLTNFTTDLSLPFLTLFNQFGFSMNYFVLEQRMKRHSGIQVVINHREAEMKCMCGTPTEPGIFDYMIDEAIPSRKLDDSELEVVFTESHPRNEFPVRACSPDKLAPVKSVFGELIVSDLPVPSKHKTATIMGDPVSGVLQLQQAKSLFHLLTVSHSY